MTARPILTECRQALWTAIETWPELDGVFKRTWRWEDTVGVRVADLVPAAGELPALAITPANGTTVWALNQGQDATYTLDVIFWTPHHDVRRGERIWQLLLRALWQNRPDSPPGNTQEYWRLGGAHNMRTDGPLTVHPLAGPVKMVRWSFQVALIVDWNPRLDSGLLE